MNSNQIISQARDDYQNHFFIPHPEQGLVAGRVCQFCGIDYFDVDHRDEDAAICPRNQVDYSTPEAWTPELFEWIEGEGLWHVFMFYLQETIAGYTNLPPYHEKTTWEFIKSTPEQKARALARAIGERDEPSK
jgi:hypothetical protein